MNRRTGRGGLRRPALILALLAPAALLAWLFWPVRITLEGNGTIQPRFEDLVRIAPGESGMVCRVMAKRLQEVQSGETLFEYIPSGKFSVLAHVRMTPPGGAAAEPEPVPDWYQKVEGERIARIEAANRWSARVRSQVKRALKWESDLAQRLAMTVPLEMDLMRVQARQRENTRLGRENANRVYTFNESLGESVATEHGIPLVSPATGILYSLWVQPQTQVFGAPSTTLPTPAPGRPPTIALHAGTSSPVAEIMLPGTPLEVLALMPVLPRSLHKEGGWQATLTGAGQSSAAPAGMTKIEFGRVSLNPADATLLVPELRAEGESVFVRVSLAADESATIGSAVRVRLVSPSRPRVWYWLGED